MLCQLTERPSCEFASSVKRGAGAGMPLAVFATGNNLVLVG